VEKVGGTIIEPYFVAAVGRGESADNLKILADMGFNYALFAGPAADRTNERFVQHAHAAGLTGKASIYWMSPTHFRLGMEQLMLHLLDQMRG
jgi:hypothetical protein